jgi:hypothetical protein
MSQRGSIVDGFRVCGKVSCTLLRGHVAAPLLGDDLDRAIRDGDAAHLWVQHNLVVDQGMQALATFLGNNLGAPIVGGLSLGSLADITIGSMQIGDTVSPTTPATGDTSGVGSLVYSPPLYFTYPSGGFLFQASGVIPVGECAGLTLTEEALVMRNNLVFAKAIFSQAMPSGFGLQFNHTVSFART